MGVRHRANHAPARTTRAGRTRWSEARTMRRGRTAPTSRPRRPRGQTTVRRSAGAGRGIAVVFAACPPPRASNLDAREGRRPRGAGPGLRPDLRHDPGEVDAVPPGQYRVREGPLDGGEDPQEPAGLLDLPGDPLGDQAGG